MTPSAGVGPALPVTSGTETETSVRVRSAFVSQALFPPLLRLAPHSHERPCLSVVLSGRYEERVGRRVFDPVPGSCVLKPAGEVHADRLGERGSHQLLVEWNEGAAGLGATARLWAEARCLRPATVLPLATRITHELREQDGVTPLAVEGLLLELISELVRTSSTGVRPTRAIVRARDYLHDNFRSAISVHDLAEVAGLSPDHTARVFRETFGSTIGDYLRDVRLAFAASALAGGNEPIARIALDAGFADQSHLTRHFRRRMGLTPAAYRRFHRR